MSLVAAALAEAERAGQAERAARAGQLRAGLQEARGRAGALRWALRDVLLAACVTRAPAPLHADLERRHRRLRADVDELLEQAELPGEQQEEAGELRRERDRLEGVRCAVAAEREARRAGLAFRRGDYREALATLDAVKNSLDDLLFDDEEEKKAVRNLRSSVNAARALYAAELSSEWEETFSRSERETLSHVTYSLNVRQSDQIHLRSLIETLHAVGRLDVELCQFSEFFIDKIVTCIIQNSCEIFTDENIDTVIFNIKFDPSDGKSPSFHSIFNNLIAVFEFIQSTMDSTFENGATFISVLSESIGKKFFDKLIDDCIKKYLPDCNSSYQQYKTLTSELDTFNKFLIEIKFIPKDKSPLDQYMQNSDCMLYKKKCEKLLSKVRRLLSQSISHATLEVSTDYSQDDSSLLNVTEGKEVSRDVLNKPLFLPRCVVSQNVKSIMSLIVDHLNESSKLPTLYSTQLVEHIKDVAVMYQTLVPNMYKVNLKNCPLDIALFFNNCFYLAHGLLGPPWRHVLPAELADALNTTLVECVQDLRVLGMHYLSHYLQGQKNIIVEAIRPNEHINWDYDNYEWLSTAITNSMKVMQALKRHWLGILPTQMYEKSTSMLVTEFCNAILNKIFNTKNKSMSEELVYMMSAKIEEATVEVQALFKEPVDLALTISVWRKFSQMSQLLSGQLLEVSSLWGAGSGPLAQVYSCEEVRHVVKMRFPDDDFRLRILASIQ